MAIHAALSIRSTPLAGWRWRCGGFHGWLRSLSLTLAGGRLRESANMPPDEIDAF